MKAFTSKRFLVWWWVVLSLAFQLPTFAQPGTYFDIIPDLGGLYDHGQGWIVKPDTDAIYVLGDLIDIQSTPGDTAIRPFFARFDYEGNMEYMRILHDTLLDGEFNISTKPVILYQGSLLCYINFLHDTAHYYRASMMELDCSTGDILRYRLFPHPPGRDSASAGEYYYMDSSDIITTFHYLYAEEQIYIRQIAAPFKLINGILVDQNEWENFPSYVKSVSDSTFVLVGTAIRGPYIYPIGWKEANLFYMKVSNTGEIIQYKLIPELEYEIITSDAGTYTVLRKSNGDWIVPAKAIRVLDQFGGYYDAIPFVASVSPEFDTLRWLNFFAEEPFEGAQAYSIFSTSWAADSSGFVVLARNYKQADRTSYLTKISPEGETEWTRHYIPIGFEHEQLSWANMEDVKATPHNTYVLAGTFFDRTRSIRRPWVMHVDSMGCLIPGCDRVVSISPPDTDSMYLFSIFPNPASDMIYLNYNGSSISLDRIQLSILNSSGTAIRKTESKPVAGGQYFFPVSDLLPGEYFILIEGIDHNYQQTLKFIKI